ncbi:MAG: hypothetical protein IJT23_08040 [Clostridia bacterium]|nr:hypothetical protein [Clostridia bacterium]
MKNKIILLSAIFLLSVSAVFASEPQLLTDNVYYSDVHFYKEQNGKLTEQFKANEGDMICRYTVTNNNGSTGLYSAVCGVYDSGNAMVSVKSSSALLASGESRVFSLNADVPSGGSVKVYLVSNLNVRTPITALEALTDKSSDKALTAFTAGEYEGVIDRESHRITLELPFGKSLSDYDVNTKVSEGASAELNNDVLTVIAEDKTTARYAVEIKSLPSSLIIDCENAQIGMSAVDMNPDIWTQSSRTAIAEEDGNKFIKQIDDDGDGSSGGRAELRANNKLAFNAPFIISCRVRYGYIDGVTARDTVNNYTSCSFQARSGGGTDTLCGFQAAQSGAGYVFQYLNNGSYKGLNGSAVNPGEWYTVTMKYYRDGDKMYVDYTFTDENGNTLEASKIPSNRTETQLNTLYAPTSTGRRAVISYDDITVQEISTDNTEPYFGGNFDISAEKTIITDVFGGSVQTDFDITMDSTDGMYDLYSFGNTSHNISRIIMNDGALEYIYDNEEYPFYISLSEGQKYHFSIRNIDDAVSKKSRIAVYLDGLCIGELIPYYETDSLSRFTFGEPISGTNHIEGFTVKRCS